MITVAKSTILNKTPIRQSEIKELDPMEVDEDRLLICRRGKGHSLNMLFAV